MSYIVSAAESIASHLHPGMLVVLESTTYPGTTEEVVQPLLEASGLRAGSDFFLAFSPERVDPGNPTFQTHNVPKVVGGLTPECSELAAALYGTAIKTIVPVSSTRVAEMVKLLENTFRAVNIGLVNELAMMCDRMNIDVWEVVEAARTKPFGFMAFYPGPGLGGHCIPIDPVYLSWKAKQSGFDPRFIELAGHINGAMPHYVVEKVAEALNSTPQGAERLDDPDRRGRLQARHRRPARVPRAGRDGTSPCQRSARVVHRSAHPVIDARSWSGQYALSSVPANRRAFGQYDCVVIVTDHQDFDYRAMVERADLVVDTRNAIKFSAPNVFRLGAPRPETQNAFTQAGEGFLGPGVRQP